MTLKSSFFIFFSLIFALLDAKPPEINPSQAKAKSEEIFKAHVSFKQFDREIAKRSLQNYVEILDPSKTYFLESEVVSSISPSDDLLEETVNHYHKAKFVHFQEIYQKMILAIERRNRLENDIADKDYPEKVKASEFQDLKWVKSEEELTRRLLKIKALQLDAALRFEPDSKDLFMQKIQKRRLSHEAEIKGSDKSDLERNVLANFLKAMSASLDTHTAYFTPQEAKQFMIQVQQRLFGIGAQLRDDLNGFTLVRLLEGGPALRSGKLKTGDKIIAVNNEPVIGMDIVEAVELIRGPQGSSVTLTILREVGEEETEIEKFQIDIVRDEIVLKESRFEKKVEPYGDGVIAHLRLFSFYQDPKHSSSKDIKEAIAAISKEHKLYGVVLDLRNNAGGVLTQAVAVTGLFIDQGIVVSVKDNNQTIQHLRNFEEEKVWDGPLLVLTNRGSASAAEIVAQTLQDYGRTLIVGDDHTFGKGSYQTFTLDPSNNGKVNPQGEFKVTRGLYYTVSGHSPQLVGAQANIVVPGGLSEMEIGESFTDFPIKNDDIGPNFEDKLTDIHPFHRLKVSRMYKNRQQVVDLYKPYLPLLKQNSEKRIAANKNYQNFLMETKKTEVDEEAFEEFGQNDLQLEETMNIMKDLIQLTSEEKFFVHDNFRVSRGGEAKPDEFDRRSS